MSRLQLLPFLSYSGKPIRAKLLPPPPTRLGLKTEIFTIIIFSNFVKIDNYQGNFFSLDLFAKADTRKGSSCNSFARVN